MKHVITLINISKSRKLIWTTASIVILIIISVASYVTMNKCYGWFYDALVSRDGKSATYMILIYILCMSTIAVCDSELYYRKRLFSIESRIRIYEYYGVDALDENKCKLSCQRMSQDVAQFGWQFINLFSSLLHSALLLPAFCFVVMNLVNPFVALGAIGYSILCSVLSRKVGNPVAKLQYAQESAEGTLRRELIKQIALEEKILPSLNDPIRTMLELSTAERWLQYFKHGYDRLSHVVPYAIMMPYYFFFHISVGTMVQAGTGLSRIITEVSFFVNNIDKVAEFQATIRRIKELDVTKEM